MRVSDTVHFAPESLRAIDTLAAAHSLVAHTSLRSLDGVTARARDRASGRIVTSVGLEWASVLVAVCDGGDADGAPFETAATPDQTLVVSLNGPSEIARLSGGRWRRAVRVAGSAGLTPGGTSDRLRRWARDGQPIQTAHLYLPHALFDDARDHCRRAGTASCDAPLDALAFRDPAVTHAVLALLRGMQAGAPGLYAESVAQYLATHLLVLHAPWSYGAAEPLRPGLLPDRRLARVVEYMSAHFREPLRLDRLAREAGISKYHFVRLFRAAVGEAPHRFLIRLRLDAARQMLRDTDATVAEIAPSIGYTSAAQFGAAFRRDAGTTPLAYRAAARPRPR